MHNVIILGSGRSGTSMITGVLANSGYFVGKNSKYLKMNSANPKGYYEDYEINTINEDILKNNLVNIPESIRKLVFPSFTFYRARWLAKLPINHNIKSTAHIDKRIKAVINNEPFCYKDPRFSYTLPIWNNFLKPDTKFIVVFREPNKTVNSILRECEESLALKKLKMTRTSAMEIWFLMYSHILKNFKKSLHPENWMFFHYDQIFIKQKVSELEIFVNLKLDLDFVEKNIGRSNNDEQPLQKKVETLYDELLKLSY